MAWSEAARRAAALVRKLHSKARKEGVSEATMKRHEEIGWPLKRYQRQIVAADIRHLRKVGKKGFPKYAMPSEVEAHVYRQARVAVVSTAMRNVGRRLRFKHYGRSL